MIGNLAFAFVLALLFVACIREACNEKESRWLRILGHALGAVLLVVLLWVSRGW